ncbi:MAG: ABC transporter permease [Candidatus Tectomicrobia bacterium]|nr:ABC transporter permease [Candidatus Tectomicrobia bacterium]
MLRLIRFLTIRHLTEHRQRSLVTLFGVALGVAVLVAIRITNSSTLNSFRDTVVAISGKAVLQVAGDETGFDENLFTEVRNVRGIASAAPLIQSTAPIAGTGDVVLVVGVDIIADTSIREYELQGEKRLGDPLELLTDPDTILLSEKLARKYALNAGSTIKLVTPSGLRELKIKGILSLKGPARALGGNFALMDIAAAQIVFQKVGRLDKIDLTIQEGVPLESVQDQLTQAVDGGAKVERPGARNESVEKMLKSFQVNLTVLSMIALLVGMFLIYNTMSFAVIQRRKEIGILRSLGVFRRKIASLLLFEAMMFGLFGSTLGFFLGIALSRLTTKVVARTVNSLFLLVNLDSVAVTPGTLFLGLSVGLITALVSAALPISEAMRVTPRETLQTGTYEEKRTTNFPLFFAGGMVVLALAYALSKLDAIDGVPIFGYLSCFFLVLGASMLTPGVTVFFSRLFRPSVTRILGIEGRLSCENLVNSLGRTSIAIASLMTGFAMMISVAIMVNSFEKTVYHWVDQTISADLILNSAAKMAGAGSVRMPEELGEAIKEIEGVLDVDSLRLLNVNYQGETVLATVITLDVLARYGKLIYRSGEKKEIFRRVIDEGAITVSENFSVRFGTRVGDMITLDTPSGRVGFRVVGVGIDYSSDRGTILMDRATFKRYWNDYAVDTYGVFVRPDADPSAVSDAIAERFGEKHNLYILTNRAFKLEILDLIRQTFTITYGLELIAIVVAVMGIVNTLFASIMERTREIGILRSIGATKGQVRKVVMIEATLMGIIGSVLGILTGIALSFVLIFVINKQSFGWTLQVSYPYPMMIYSTLLIMLTSIVAGYFPARKASAVDLTEAVQYE